MGPVRCPCWQLVDRSFDVRILGSGARRAIGRSPHAASRAASISRPRIRWVPYRLALRRTARAPLQPNPRPWCFIGRWTPRPPPTRPLPPTRPSPRASRPTSTGRSRSSFGPGRPAVLDRAARPRRPAATPRSSSRTRFVRAYRALGGVRRRPDPRAQAPGWLTTIVVNAGRNRARVRRVPTTELAFEPGAEPAADPVGAARRPRDVGAPAGDPAARPSGSPSSSATSTACRTPRWPRRLGRPEGTVKAQVHRGLAALRTALLAAERPRARGDARMTRLDPSPPPRPGGTPGRGDRGRALDARRARARPASPTRRSSRSAWPTTTP